MASAEIGVLLLASGQLLKIRGVTLYPVEVVAEISQKREIAASKLGGVSTGIGFLGSPGWAIGAGAALGLLEGALSSAARKEAIRTLLVAEKQHIELRRNGRVFPFDQIINRDQPNPNLWKAEEQVSRRLDYRSLSRQERQNLLTVYGKDKSHVVDHHVEIHETRTFAHDGSEFFAADTETGIMHIRWQNVVAFTTT